MTTDFQQFGDPSRFSISLRWADDNEPRARRPRAHGWSTGDLRLSVGGVLLTNSRFGSRVRGHAGWYLSPWIDWLTVNWRHLLHEEDFAWFEPTGLPAAVACRKAMHQWIGAKDADGRTQYRAAQDWYRRHAIRSAAEGGLLPDLFIRRLVDDVELSWTAQPPIQAPEDFRFTAEPAHVVLPVSDVAEPLWQALQWFARCPPPDLEADDKERWEEIAARIDSLENLSVGELEAPYLAEGVADMLERATASLEPEAVVTSIRSDRAPVIEEFSPMVAMFGGVSPGLSQADAAVLLSLLGSMDGDDDPRLAGLVAERGLSPLGVPHRDGEDYARDLLDDLDLPGDAAWIDVEGIAQGLGIAVERRAFEAKAIRGVALAGRGLRSRMIVNTTSIYNVSTEGQRFTIAHELCHVLHDRSRARRVTHVSGPWVAQGFERRANAFAAYFLMPRELVLRHAHGMEPGQPETVRHVAASLHVSESALVEHMFNIRLVNDWQREQLRAIFGRTLAGDGGAKGSIGRQ